MDEFVTAARDQLGIEEVKTKTKKLIIALFLEFLGTMILTLFAISSYYIKTTYHKDLHTGLGAGFTIIALCTAFGKFSGCHINPAITFAQMSCGTVKIIRGILYIIVQILGGICAGIIVKLFLKKPHIYLGINILHYNLNTAQGIFMEAIATMLLVLVVLAVTDSARAKIFKAVSPIAIGFAIIGGHLVTLRFTSAGLNPARTLGPAIAYGYYDDIAVFIFGQILGALLAVIVYHIILYPHYSSKQEELEEDEYPYECKYF